MAGVTTADLARKIIAQERKIQALITAMDKLTNQFALYWLEGNKPPCFAIRIRENKRGSADLLVITERLSKPDLKLNKQILEPDDEDKTGKWEPLVLPMGMLIELERLKAEESKVPKQSSKDLFDEESK